MKNNNENPAMTWHTFLSYWKNDAWQKFKLANLALLCIILATIALFAMGFSQEVTLWGSCAISICIVFFGLYWGERRKQRHTKVERNESSTLLRQGYNIDCYIHISMKDNQKLKNILPSFAGSGLINTSIGWKYVIGPSINIDKIISLISGKERPAAKLNLTGLDSRPTLINAKNTAVSAKLPFQSLLETTYSTNTGTVGTPVLPVAN
jgi:hypothetical protein